MPSTPLPHDPLPDRGTLERRHDVHVLGEGATTLLLVHGYGCNQAMWRRLAPSLAHRHRVVLFDLAGFGNSDFGAWDEARHAGLDGHAQDVLALAHSFCEGPTVLVGHSVGAMVGVVAELMDPGRFTAHVMVAPSPCFINDGDYRGGFGREALEALLAEQQRDMRSWSNLVAGLVMKQPGADDLTMELVESFCKAYPPAATTLARTTFLDDHREAIARVSKPTLILQSAHDDLADLAVGAYMHRQMPDGRLRVLASWGHCPHLVSPDLCLEAIDEFLTTLG